MGYELSVKAMGVKAMCSTNVSSLITDHTVSS
jgi:hypothetical protein